MNLVRANIKLHLRCAEVSHGQRADGVDLFERSGQILEYNRVLRESYVALVNLQRLRKLREMQRGIADLAAAGEIHRGCVLQRTAGAHVEVQSASSSPAFDSGNAVRLHDIQYFSNFGIAGADGQVDVGARRRVA